MQLNFYFAQYGLLQSMVCTMIDVQTNSITAEFSWKPTENTLIYLPMKTDLLDHSNNNIEISNNSGVVIQNGFGSFNGSSRLLINNFNTYLNSLPFTVAIWINSQNGNNVGIFTSSNVYSGGYRGWNFGKMASNESNKVRLECLPSGNVRTSSSVSDNTWILYGFSIQSGSAKVYKNGVVDATMTSFNLQFVANLRIGNQRFASQYGEENFFKGFMSEYIIEKKARSDNDWLTYFNKTKKHFGY